ncbi:hypothetical protein COV16_02795 [Candidatus Woesearchaeota archaeon CG10_big_fil_rev_8_21_14_0_10_34_8]|nr:MAG: hypothetical protein COV16_02795 [Candidatus Woesearchaeota archaeon CG10_big_fil_rev_8_21_14_0_10_34_8]
MEKYTATVRGVTPLNDQVKLFRLEFEKPFEFQAGQFVILNITDADGNPQRRSYSIASSPKNKDYIELCIKIVSNGRVSSIMGQLQEGANIELDGPYGKFTVDKEQKKELLLIAAGVGIAPIRSLVLDLCETGYSQAVSLFFGFRYMNDCLFKDECLKLKQEFPNFNFYPIISRPEEDSENWMDVGHVNAVLPKYVNNAEGKEVYICGSLPMVKDVVSALEEIGFNREQIRTDAWG